MPLGVRGCDPAESTSTILCVFGGGGGGTTVTVSSVSSGPSPSPYQEGKERVRTPRPWSGIVCDFSSCLVCVVGREGCLG